MADRKLRAVRDGEQVVKSRKKTVKKPSKVEAAAEESERDLLVALRSHLAREIDKGAVPAHALASVSSKIREYDRDIRAIDARESEEVGAAGEVPDAKFDASAI